MKTDPNLAAEPQSQPGCLQRVVRRRLYTFYCLIENGKRIRYFGITNQRPGRRLLQHFSDATRKRTDHRVNWIRQCIEEGIHIDIHVLKTGLTFNVACLMEIRFIRFFKTVFSLVNTHRGGNSGYDGLPDTSKRKHKSSCLEAKSREPMEHRKWRSKLMNVAKARHRICRGESLLERLEQENEMEMGHQKFQAK